MWCINRRSCVYGLLGIFFLALAAPAFAKARPGIVYVAELEGVRTTDLAWLIAQDYDIDHCVLPRVQVYALLEELKALDLRGIAYQVVEVQPNPPNFTGNAKALGEYHNHTTMTAMLQSYASSYPAITRLVNIGNSVEGRALWALQITDNPDVEEDEPEFKYVSTIHGDELIGTENCLYFIDLLLTSYGQSTAEGQRLTNLINSTDIWIMPMMNPDGNTAGRRYNAMGVDLNRNFPSYVQDDAGGNVFDDDPLMDEGRQIEVQHMMHWTIAHSFVQSANFHGGALLVNYPYDEDFVTPGQPAICPDDAMFIDISKRYSIQNSPMWNSPVFPMGISNGSDWYTVYGGMQDWNYRYTSCNEVTIELSNTKRPTASLIPTYWSQNKESMLAYLEAVHIGIRGLVTDASTGDPVYARVTIDGNTQAVYTDPDVGDYHRMLLPGTYNMTVSAPGYADQRVENVQVNSGNATRVDVLLSENVEGETSYTLSLTTSGEGTGTVELSPNQASYVPGQTVLITAVPAVGSAFAGWGGADATDVQPDANTAIALIIMNGNKVLTAGFDVAAGEGEGEGETAPPFATADRDQNLRFSLSELLRIIQLYNSDGFHCDGAGEDGFALGSGDQSCAPHTSDYTPRDWRIALSELLRAIQFYNANGYHVCAGSEDGYCPGSEA